MSSDLVPLPPKVPLERRAGALAIDAAIAWVPSAILGTHWIVQCLLFVMLWWVLRVAIAFKTQGQSLGRWALNLRVVDVVFTRTPGIQALSQRELPLGLCAALALAGLGGLTSTNAAVVLLMLPLAIDGCVALADTQRYPQALHDRLAKTIVIGTRRGYSLDIKLRSWVDQLQRNVRR